MEYFLPAVCVCVCVCVRARVFALIKKNECCKSMQCFQRLSVWWAAIISQGFISFLKNVIPMKKDVTVSSCSLKQHFPELTIHFQLLPFGEMKAELMKGRIDTAGR